MIIRVTNKASGILDYLINGRVSSGMHRDEYDIRIPISGSMEDVGQEISWCQNNKKWATNYKHFTVGFSSKEAKRILSASLDKQREILSTISLEVLKHHFPHRAEHFDVDQLVESESKQRGRAVSKEEVLDKVLTHYCEMHVPKNTEEAKYKWELNKDGKKVRIQRLPHLHIVLPLRDVLSDNKLVCIQKNDAYMSAIQSDICNKSGLYLYLEDPAIAMIEKQRLADQGIATDDRKKIETKIGTARSQMVDYLLEKQPKTPSELYKALRECPLVDTAQKSAVRATGSNSKGSRYLQVKLHTKKRNGEPEILNIRGKNLEFIEALYDKYRTTSDNKIVQRRSFTEFKKHFIKDRESPHGLTGSYIKALDKAKKRREKIHASIDGDSVSREEITNDKKIRDDVIAKHKKRFMDRKHNVKFANDVDKRRAEQRAKKLSDIGETYQDLNPAQKGYFVMYGTNIEKRFVEDGKFYRPKYNPELIVFKSKELECEIVDYGDKLTASTSKRTDEHKVAELMLQQALAKGWDLDSIEPEGSPEFKEIAKKLIEEAKRKEKLALLRSEAGLTQIAKLTQVHKPAKTSVNQEYEALAKREANKSGAEKCKAIKNHINIEDIKAIAFANNIDLPKCLREVESKNGQRRFIFDGATKEYNAIDLLNKQVGLEIGRSIELLHERRLQAEVLQKQQETLQAKLDAECAKVAETDSASAPERSRTEDLEMDKPKQAQETVAITEEAEKDKISKKPATPFDVKTPRPHNR